MLGFRLRVVEGTLRLELEFEPHFMCVEGGEEKGNRGN